MKKANILYLKCREPRQEGSSL